MWIENCGACDRGHGDCACNASSNCYGSQCILSVCCGERPRGGGRGICPMACALFHCLSEREVVMLRKSLTVDDTCCCCLQLDKLEKTTFKSPKEEDLAFREVCVCPLCHTFPNLHYTREHDQKSVFFLSLLMHTLPVWFLGICCSSRTIVCSANG